MLARHLLAAASAATLLAAPVAVSAQPSAKALSITNSVRASAPTTNASRQDDAGFLGGNGVAAAIGAGIAAIVIIAVVNDSDDDDNDADSN